MSITVITFIVIALLVLGLKVRRGTFFRWSGKLGAPPLSPDGRDDDNALR
jgi:hypothetical protein